MVGGRSCCLRNVPVKLDTNTHTHCLALHAGACCCTSSNNTVQDAGCKKYPRGKWFAPDACDGMKDCSATLHRPIFSRHLHRCKLPVRCEVAQREVRERRWLTVKAADCSPLAHWNELQYPLVATGTSKPQMCHKSSYGPQNEAWEGEFMNGRCYFFMD